MTLALMSASSAENELCSSTPVCLYESKLCDRHLEECGSCLKINADTGKVSCFDPKPSGGCPAEDMDDCIKNGSESYDNLTSTEPLTLHETNTTEVTTVDVGFPLPSMNESENNVMTGNIGFPLPRVNESEKIETNVTAEDIGFPLPRVNESEKIETNVATEDIGFPLPRANESEKIETNVTTEDIGFPLPNDSVASGGAAPAPSQFSAVEEASRTSKVSSSPVHPRSAAPVPLSAQDAATQSNLSASGDGKETLTLLSIIGGSMLVAAVIMFVKMSSQSQPDIYEDDEDDDDFFDSVVESEFTARPQASRGFSNEGSRMTAGYDNGEPSYAFRPRDNESFERSTSSSGSSAYSGFSTIRPSDSVSCVYDKNRFRQIDV